MTGRKARENTQRPWSVAAVGQDAIRSMEVEWELGHPVACGSSVSGQLMMTLNHLPFTIMSRHSATLSASCTGECVPALAGS